MTTLRFLPIDNVPRGVKERIVSRFKTQLKRRGGGGDERVKRTIQCPLRSAVDKLDCGARARTHTQYSRTIYIYILYIHCGAVMSGKA